MSVRPTHSPAWATTSGDVWAERWPELDRGLAGVAERLDSAILAAAPPGPIRALDIGCGAGSTSLALATARPDVTIIACDLSSSLVKVAEGRLAGKSVEARLGDAEEVAAREGPFDLIYSRHGVMFFADPARAFRAFRSAARAGASLAFSCFENWAANSWASELASAAAGHPVDPPGRKPGGFAFADADYVGSMIESAGWIEVERQSVSFRYLAGSGPGAVSQALSLLSAVGPASIILRDLAGDDRDQAAQRMRATIEHHFDGSKVEFPASACLWIARAGA